MRSGRHPRHRGGPGRRLIAGQLMLVVAAALLSTLGQLGSMVAAFVALTDSSRRSVAMPAGLLLLAVGYLAGRWADAAGLQLHEQIADGAERRIWLRLLSLPITFFGERSMRDLIGYANSVAMTRTLLGALGVETALGALTALAASALLALVDIWLGLAGLAAAALILAVTAGLYRLQQRHDLVVMESVDAAHALLHPALLGAEELSVYRAQASVERGWAAVFARQKAADLRGLRYADAAESLLLATQPVMLAVLLPLAVSRSGGIGFAAGAVTLIVLQLSMALSRLCGVFPALFSIGLARARLAPVRDTPAEQDHTVRHEANLAGRIELRNVGFGYSETGSAVLRDVSLVVEPGELVAVVGSSGAGKSTLLRLVLAQLTPTSGRVLIDGVDTREWDHERLRRQIGYVPQSAALLRGTLRETVAGLHQVEDEEIWAALRTANLADLVAGLPMGLDTRVLDGDSAFSGGQEQRLLIARALVRKPRVLLLDEATSALDEATQSIVTDAIGELGITRIVVAHRHSTLAAADRIYVVRDGVVVEQGGYHELRAAGGAFAALTRQLPGRLVAASVRSHGRPQPAQPTQPSQLAQPPEPTQLPEPTPPTQPALQGAL